MANKDIKHIETQYWNIMLLSGLSKRLQYANAHKISSPTVWSEIFLRSSASKRKMVTPYYQQNEKYWARNPKLKAPVRFFQLYKTDDNNLLFGIDIGEYIKDSNIIDTANTYGITVLTVPAGENDTPYHLGIFNKNVRSSDVEAHTKINTYSFIHFSPTTHAFLIDEVLTIAKKYAHQQAQTYALEKMNGGSTSTGRIPTASPQYQNMPGLTKAQVAKFYLLYQYGHYQPSNNIQPEFTVDAEVQKKILNDLVPFINEWTIQYGLDVKPLIHMLEHDAINEFFAILQHQIDSCKLHSNKEYALDVFESTI